MTHADEMNARALAEGLRQVREDTARLGQVVKRMEQSIQLLENTVQMHRTMIQQLQELFATKTVDRGSGPTT